MKLFEDKVRPPKIALKDMHIYDASLHKIKCRLVILKTVAFMFTCFSVLTFADLNIPYLLVNLAVSTTTLVGSLIVSGQRDMLRAQKRLLKGEEDEKSPT